MKIAGTGHRPHKLGGYTPAAVERVHKVAVRSLVLLKPDVVTSGMAIGWDTELALAAIELGIPLLAAIPFLGQESRWPAQSRLQYERILKQAAEVRIICEGGYHAWKMIQRDKWMVDDSDGLLALWNGDDDGGTAQTVKYAMKGTKPIWNAWKIYAGTSYELTGIGKLQGVEHGQPQSG